MKIGWLVWEDGDKHPALWTGEPPSWYSNVVQIVYSEIVK